MSIKRTAYFSGAGLYRYSLGREWNSAQPSMTMVMLNPSVANEVKDDPTTTFCMNVARRDGFGRYVAVNLFALVGTDPRCLTAEIDPIGVANDEHIRDAVKQSDRVIVAWGNGGDYLHRGYDVLRMLTDYKLHCFGYNKNGSPRFPRALRGDVDVVPFTDTWRGGRR